MVTTNESVELAADVARQIFKASAMDVSEESQLFADLVEMARASIRGEALFPDRQPESSARRFSSATAIYLWPLSAC
jgi:hypothetical protein